MSDPLNAAAMKRVLFLRPEKIGDMVISLPVFDALREAYPHIRISVLASPRSLPLIKNDPRFDRIFVYDKSVFGSIKLLGEMKREKHDCVLDMIDNDSATTLICSQYVAGVAPTIGIGKEAHAQYFDFNLEHDDGIGGHIVDNTLKLLLPLGVDIARANRYAPPFISEEQKSKCAQYMAGIKSSGRAGIIGINLSAGQPNRRWPDAKFIQLIKLLTNQQDDYAVLLIAIPAERGRAELIRSTIDSDVSLVPDKLSLTEVSSIIAECDLLISPDTSLIHIARSFDIPVVGLYNHARKNFTRWQPFNQPDGYVMAEHWDRLDDIEPERVASQVATVLKRVTRTVE